MLQNGFEHRQYSGYVSKEAMEDDDVALIALILLSNFGGYRLDKNLM